MEVAKKAPPRARKSLILCFDGTGDKFTGSASDSNIVKIFSLLDREDTSQYHYYQPGIGTYVETSSLSKKSRIGRIKSWSAKTKDMMYGSSFGEHVMSGYKSLMRYHATGDHIYIFGFSRGSYTARFLAQMLDYVGLLAAGNEEMLRFAWKTFARWQMRTEGTEGEKAKKKVLFDFMQKFRETFSRPIERIRFLGLFDCVNSVPVFESAWLRRTKFPYTARNSALVIRHAVSIDERRSKFRQDLTSQKRSKSDDHAFKRFRPKRRAAHSNVASSGEASMNQGAMSAESMDSNSVTLEKKSRPVHGEDDDLFDENDIEQDVLEVWFAGQHGDIGGGWTLEHGEERPASDLPLIWMLREACKAGLPFDEDKLEASGLLVRDIGKQAEAPVLQLDGHDLPRSASISAYARPQIKTEEDMLRLETGTRVHDSLALGGGMKWMAVLGWQVLEMNLENEIWKPIRWPLPRGETRDIPNDALIHSSVIRRMEKDKSYRPGNLIIGGGGRGVRIAPEKYGIGNWKVAREAGDRVGEVVMRDIIANETSEMKQG